MYLEICFSLYSLLNLKCVRHDTDTLNFSSHDYLNFRPYKAKNIRCSRIGHDAIMPQARVQILVVWHLNELDLQSFKLYSLTTDYGFVFYMSLPCCYKCCEFSWILSLCQHYTHTYTPSHQGQTEPSSGQYVNYISPISVHWPPGLEMTIVSPVKG